MAKERQNFVYGNEEEGVKGCIANALTRRQQNQIYDDMTDFAKYAFNKSHAAAYAVVAYQTGILKYYYPKEFMAAFMTSVMDNDEKGSEYILNCRNMNIPILPPDINEDTAGSPYPETASAMTFRHQECGPCRGGRDHLRA